MALPTDRGFLIALSSMDLQKQLSFKSLLRHEWIGTFEKVIHNVSLFLKDKSYDDVLLQEIDKHKLLTATIINMFALLLASSNECPPSLVFKFIDCLIEGKEQVRYRQEYFSTCMEKFESLVIWLESLSLAQANDVLNYADKHEIAIDYALIFNSSEKLRLTDKLKNSSLGRSFSLNPSVFLPEYDAFSQQKYAPQVEKYAADSALRS